MCQERAEGPKGYYNVQGVVLGKVTRKGEVGLCGTCMDAAACVTRS